MRSSRWVAVSQSLAPVDTTASRINRIHRIERAVFSRAGFIRFLLFLDRWLGRSSSWLRLMDCIAPLDAPHEGCSPLPTVRHLQNQRVLGYKSLVLRSVSHCCSSHSQSAKQQVHSIRLLKRAASAPSQRAATGEALSDVDRAAAAGLAVGSRLVRMGATPLLVDEWSNTILLSRMPTGGARGPSIRFWFGLVP